MQLPDGGSIFIKVIPVSGVRKNATYIASLHVEVTDELSGRFPGTCAGWVMDNTSANHLGFVKMQLINPKWILVGCAAHRLALIVKVSTNGIASMD